MKAAMECFLGDDYHRVTTRQIAAAAGANISMIRYYFGNKEGLYEEMIRQTMQPLLDVFNQTRLSSGSGFADFFKLYYHTMRKNPRFPALIVKVLALNHGPGKQFIHQLMQQGKSRGYKKVDELKRSGQIDSKIDPDIFRIAFVSLAMMPMLLKRVFEEEMGREIGVKFLEELAEFNGRLFSKGLLSWERDETS